MKSLITVSILGLMLAGCSGSGGGEISRSDVTATQSSISSYDVDGTSAPVAGPTPIDASENNGQFSVSFDIEANGTVDVELSVIESDGGSFSCGSETTEFFDVDCGPDQACGLQDTLDCRFETSNEVSCNGGPKTDLTPFLDTLPKRASMILCVSRSGGGSASSHGVEFR